jgi:hypothetical protein
VRRQMAERHAAHDDSNLARSLTPAEKREKKMRKLFDDNGMKCVNVAARQRHTGRMFCKGCLTVWQCAAIRCWQLAA